MIKKIGCVEVPVSDMDEAVAFYENILGLKKMYEHSVWTAFDVGGTRFALAASGTKRSMESAKRCTSCSLCVLRYVAGKWKPDEEKPTATAVLYLEVDDLDEVYETLKEKGTKFVAAPREQGWGGRTTVILDPDKNILVLSEA